MNLYTLIGAAIADEDFRELLFEDPIRAARRLGIPLTNLEVDALRPILKIEGVKKHFALLSSLFCNHPPCPLKLAAPCDDEDSQIAAD